MAKSSTSASRNILLLNNSCNNAANVSQVRTTTAAAMKTPKDHNRNTFQIASSSKEGIPNIDYQGVTSMNSSFGGAAHNANQQVVDITQQSSSRFPGHTPSDQVNKEAASIL